eukprot:gnl/TRDRNA2_/TRDRNA2_136104_c1_seq2.p1 gnl/TRDRNA2_/TRDRNA2_136104_c1~~gnl/TRDRNA2_/TRDRNA2_136104_c1_seq2.p1  ORF type:complete len:402 (-),score=70.43 gnl/TRDRNA2_/TRDRNA2_136104_c1_seq2:222-1343(-)
MEPDGEPLFTRTGCWDYPLSRAEKLERAVQARERNLELKLAKSTEEMIQRREDSWRRQIAELEMQLTHLKRSSYDVPAIAALPTPLRASQIGTGRSATEAHTCSDELWRGKESKMPFDCPVFFIGDEPAEDLIARDALAEDEAEAEDPRKDLHQAAKDVWTAECDWRSAGSKHPSMDSWLVHMMADYDRAHGDTEETGAQQTTPEREDDSVRAALDKIPCSPDDAHTAVLQSAWHVAALELVGDEAADDAAEVEELRTADDRPDEQEGGEEEGAGGGRGGGRGADAYGQWRSRRERRRQRSIRSMAEQVGEEDELQPLVLEQAVQETPQKKCRKATATRSPSKLVRQTWKSKWIETLHVHDQSSYFSCKSSSP